MAATLLVSGLICLLLSIAADGAGAAGLKLRVTPARNIPAGKVTCFSGHVRGTRGNPVKGATVNLDGKMVTSKKAGKSRLCKGLNWPGRHAASAVKGKRSGSAFLRARSFGLGLGGTWVRQELQLSAYPAANPKKNRCFLGGSGKQEQPDFAEVAGTCEGVANRVSDGGIFSGRNAFIRWPTTSVGEKVELTAEAMFPTKNYGLVGYLTSEAARIYYVTSGQIDAKESKVYSGTDPGKAGQQGGPFLININRHETGLTADGYTFHFIGWVFKED
ncbi:MAG: hypothetical protein JJE13_03190 [Thermoleophilia bacterium]|nr:hypothetical protein [Thermoleophilia bacterium]